MAKRVILDTAIKSVDVEWDNGREAYSGARVQEFIKGQLCERKSEIEAAVAMTEGVASRVTKNEGDISLLNRGASEMQDDIERLESGAQELAGRVTSVEGRTSRLEGEAADLKAGLSGVSTRVDTLEDVTVPEVAAKVRNLEEVAVPEVAAAVEALDAAKADRGDFVVMSEDEYEGLKVKDDDVFYFVYEE